MRRNGFRPDRIHGDDGVNDLNGSILIKSAKSIVRWIKKGDGKVKSFYGRPQGDSGRLSGSKEVHRAPTKE